MYVTNDANDEQLEEVSYTDKQENITQQNAEKNNWTFS